MGLGNVTTTSAESKSQTVGSLYSLNFVRTKLRTKLRARPQQGPLGSIEYLVGQRQVLIDFPHKLFSKDVESFTIK